MKDVLAFYSKMDPFEDWHGALAPLLGDVEMLPWDQVDDPARVKYALVWKPPHGFFAQFPNLELVINLGAGVDQLVSRDDLPEVPITRLSDPEMSRMMAGWVLFAVLRHAREIPHFEAAQRRGEWSYRHPRHASETSVAVLGLGQLGRMAAEEIARQGYDTHGWATGPKDVPGITVHHGDAALGPLLEMAEIVVCMLPLTPKTRQVLGREAFARMRKGASFINASRGEVVDEGALIEALQSGHLSGATLDVFEKEPLSPDSPLWHLPGVLITPHLASVAIPKTAAPQIAENIARIRRGEEVLHQISQSRGY